MFWRREWLNVLLLIDNYDSFTYNLYHLFKAKCSKVEVVRNDEISKEALEELPIDGLIISPGPGRPEEAGISIDCVEVAEKHKIPLFGVCLGHQVIGYYYGCRIVRAPYPVHGKTDEIIHDSQGVFKGLKNPFKATRYHSLVVEEKSVKSPLFVTAKNREGIVMGLSHKHLPIFGVQFHPESFLSEEGERLAENFLRVVKEHAGSAKRR